MKAEHIPVDILIIGGGAAGCSAALRANALGAKVLMVVKGKMGRSGATPLASGLAVPPSLNLPPGLLQWLKKPYSLLSDHVRVPPPASYAKILAGVIKMHYGLVDQDYFLDLGLWLHRKFIPRLEDKGLFVVRDESGTPVLPLKGGHTYNFHSHGMSGYQFGETRRKEVLAADIPVIEEASAFALMTDARQQVIGALAFDYRAGRLLAITAGATIIATGHTNWLSTRATGTREMAANGLAMALRAGAELQNLEIQWFHASDLASPPSWMRLHHYPNPMAGSEHRVVMRNSDGELYMRTEEFDTMNPYTIQMKELYKQVRRGKAGWHSGSYADFELIHETALKDNQYHWEFYAKLGKNMAKDRFDCGITWHMTGGGIRANLDTMATAVPGLYIAGAVGGHVLGGLGPATFDGEIAAAAALRHASRSGRPTANAHQVESAESKLGGLLARSSDTRTDDALSPIAIKTRIREIVWANMMYAKTEARLQTALAEIARVRRELLPRMRLRSATTSFNFDLVDALDVEDMLDVCEVSAHASLTRKESRGPHFREDYPFTDDKNWLKQIILSVENGALRTRFEPVRQKYVRFARPRVDYLSEPHA